jgi:hypothetical protein
MPDDNLNPSEGRLPLRINGIKAAQIIAISAYVLGMLIFCGAMAWSVKK